MKTLWRIEMLGGLQARSAEQIITRFATTRTGALLAHLALFLPRAHARSGLAEALWPDAEMEAGRLSLRVALNSLRRVLEPPEMSAGAVILANRLTVQLNPDAVITDVMEFELALLEAAQASGDAVRSQALGRAIALYKGSLLPDEQDTWVLTERERLEMLFQNAQAQLAALHASQFALSATLSRPQPVPPRAASLPMGTRTLLLTSVAVPVASGNEAAWKAALAAHRAVLRREFARLGGHELHATLTEFAVVFGSVADALACALACQQGIAAQTWPIGIAHLRLAIALATGEMQGEMPAAQAQTGEMPFCAPDCAEAGALPEASEVVYGEPEMEADASITAEPLLMQAAQLLAAAHGGQRYVRKRLPCCCGPFSREMFACSIWARIVCMPRAPMSLCFR